MRNNTLVAIMVALLFCCTALVLIYTLRINVATNRMKSINTQLNAAAAVRQLIQATYGESVNYSKTHPDIIPLLQSFTNNAAPANPAAAIPTAPATNKTPGK